jgi:hypothetical protein
MESVCEKLDDRFAGHIEETDICINRVTEQLNAKTKLLETDVTRYVENTDSYVHSLRQELIQAKLLHPWELVRILNLPSGVMMDPLDS